MLWPVANAARQGAGKADSQHTIAARRGNKPGAQALPAQDPHLCQAAAPRLQRKSTDQRVLGQGLEVWRVAGGQLVGQRRQVVRGALSPPVCQAQHLALIVSWHHAPAQHVPHNVAQAVGLQQVAVAALVRLIRGHCSQGAGQGSGQAGGASAGWRWCGGGAHCRQLCRGGRAGRTPRRMHSTGDLRGPGSSSRNGLAMLSIGHHCPVQTCPLLESSAALNQSTPREEIGARGSAKEECSVLSRAVLSAAQQCSPFCR
jgi:hypothetical protein